MIQSRAHTILYAVWMGGAGGFGDGLPMVAGFVYERGKIMIGSTDNSSGVVVGALVCRTKCSGFKSCFILGFFIVLENFPSSRRNSVHNEIPLYARSYIGARGLSRLIRT